jgi:hypothetical protein
MKKHYNMYRSYIAPISLVILFTFVSCSDFLDEEFLSGENSASIVSSEETFETLVNAAYVSLRAWYGKENAWDLTEAGTDLYTYGLDNRSIGFCIYSSFTGAEEQERMGAVWREIYKALNTCNLAIRELENVPYENDEIKSRRLGELTFLRAHYLWLIAEIWGGVHFSTEPSETAIHEANRTPIETFYQQIFDDLRTARSRAPVSWGAADYGRITRPAAEAMLARVHLYQANYDSAAYYATSVINNYGFQLMDDWSELWDIENILNDETIWSVNYSDDPTFTNPGFTDTEGDEYTNEGIIQRDGGHNGHLMWEIRYENLSWGMVRDIENGRGFQRWGPTKFFLDLFDEEVDERFFGSFKNVWYCNSEDVIPRWRPFIYIEGERITLPMEMWAKPMFAVGDTAIYFSKTPVPESEKGKLAEDDIHYIHPEKGYIIIDINDMYLPDGSMNDPVINRQFYFPITKKYEDPTRLEIATQYGKRDAIVFRISEMYLIAAEAEMMRGNTGAAVDFMNTLRETRSVEGREAEMTISASDLDIDFILDERARELATEFQRYFDLKRTNKLVERVREHNHDAQAIEDFHRLRFVPQSQLDAMTNSAGYQNPGY